LDENGHLVSTMIAHARQQTNVSEFSYQLAAGRTQTSGETGKK
jgi:hypothetical protein